MRLALFTLLLATGCDALPRDPDGTLERVTATRHYSVAMVEPLTRAERARATALLDEVTRRTGASARVEPAALEPSLARLHAGELDMVIAPFRKKTPWEAEVALSPPISGTEAGGHAVSAHATMRNGENRWIMLVEASARAIAPEARQ